jgi:GT2 family glycosyltransferase
MTRVDDANVVVCSWAGEDADLTLQTLAACAEQTAEGGTLLVDMSPDERIVGRARDIPGVVVHHVPGSSGLGESRQHAMSVAPARYVAFLDADAVPRPGWLAALREAVAPAGVAIAGGPVLPVWPRTPPRLFRTASAGDLLSMLDLGPAALDVPRVLPGNMIIDRTVTGDQLFAPELGRREGSLVGAEEIDTMVRVVEEGARIVYAPGAAVDHRTTSDRLTWRWMWRRAHDAGREAALHGHALAPMPRPATGADRLFMAAIAAPFLLGRLRRR